MPKRLGKSTSTARSNDTTQRDLFPQKRVGPPAWAVAIVLSLSIAAVYSKSLHAPFILDDHGGIERNSSIVSLWPLVGTSKKPGPLNPAKEMPSSGRPLVNLSLAINYSFGGLNPIGYHVFSITLHFCSAMLLFSITRRTLELPYFRAEFDAAAGWLALTVALVWALHPLQTETVTYISQRTELMMAMFYLATLYCSMRYWTERAISVGDDPGAQDAASPGEGVMPSRLRWLALAFIACLAGMASKEAMVSAPLMVLLFERAFIARSLGSALRRSWPLYVALAATWILLLALCLGMPRPHSTGFGHGVTAYTWWLTQSKVLLMYLKLVVWPVPLQIHYLLPYLTTLDESWTYVAVVLLLAIGVLWLLWRNHPVGYLGTWVFAILSPTMVVPILTETAAERRMYLPLAALAALFVVGGYWLARRLLNHRASGSLGVFGVRRYSILAASAVSLLAAGLGVMSAQRVSTYLDPFYLWREVLIAQPGNYIAHENMGHQLEERGRTAAAMIAYREAIRLKPDCVAAHNSLGALLRKKGAFEEAIREFKEAVRYDPTHVRIRNNLAYMLFATGKTEAALAELRIARELEPDDWGTNKNLGLVLQKDGKYSESIEAYQKALAIKPGDLEIYGAIAQSLLKLNERAKAVATLEQGLGLAREMGDVTKAEMLNAELKKLR